MGESLSKALPTSHPRIRQVEANPTIAISRNHGTVFSGDASHTAETSVSSLGFHQPLQHIFFTVYDFKMPQGINQVRQP